MKLIRLLVALIVCICAAPAFAQYTLVSATVTDVNGTPYAFASVTANIMNSSTTPQPIVFTGTNVAPDLQSKSTVTDATGTFTLRLADNSLLSPAGTQWKFSICSQPVWTLISGSGNVPNTSSPLFTSSQTCFNSTITISGTSQSISSILVAASSALFYLTVPSMKVSKGAMYSDGQSFVTLTDATTITWAVAGAQFANATVTLGGNRTLNVTGLVAGGSYVLRVVQDGSGSRGLVLGTGCVWKVSGGGAGAITPSTAIGAIDMLSFIYDGTNCYANFNKNFS